MVCGRFSTATMPLRSRPRGRSSISASDSVARPRITDIGEAARAATRGAVELLLVDIDTVVPGAVDDETGAVTLASEASAATYGVVDEIAGRAILTAAKVLAVRRSDIPDGASLAATLRYSQ